MTAATNKSVENESAATKLGKAALAATLAASIGVPTANSMQQAELPDVVPLTLVIDNNPPAPDDIPAPADDDHSDKARKVSAKLIMKIATVVVAGLIALFGAVQCAGTFMASQLALPAPISQTVAADDESSESAASASGDASTANQVFDALFGQVGEQSIALANGALPAI